MRSGYNWWVCGSMPLGQHSGYPGSPFKPFQSFMHHVAGYEQSGLHAAHIFIAESFSSFQQQIYSYTRAVQTAPRYAGMLLLVAI